MVRTWPGPQQYASLPGPGTTTPAISTARPGTTMPYLTTALSGTTILALSTAQGLGPCPYHTLWFVADTGPCAVTVPH
eukprot:572991-Rhodomonas_salina.1